METQTLQPKTPLRKTRDFLPPNLYSGAVLLSRHYSLQKDDFKPTNETKNLRTKIYTRHGKFYTVPPVEHPPEPGYNWQPIGRQHTRDMYVATRRYLS